MDEEAMLAVRAAEYLNGLRWLVDNKSRMPKWALKIAEEMCWQWDNHHPPPATVLQDRLKLVISQPHPEFEKLYNWANGVEDVEKMAAAVPAFAEQINPVSDKDLQEVWGD